MTDESVLERLRGQGILPVVRMSSSALAAAAVDALYEAGFRVFEITLTIPDAFGLIGEVSARQDLMVGAGTVLEATQAEACIGAGARFIVSPCCVADLVAPCRSAGLPCILGAMTPSEVHRAADLGAAAVKVFPAGALGPGHLGALGTVLPHVPLVPTGGITLDNMADFFAAGAAFVGIGSDLFDTAALEAGHSGAAERRARAYLDALQDIRRTH